MPTPKYKALLIARHAMYTNADGTPLDQQPAELEGLLDAFKPEHDRRYGFVELYSNLGEVAANTITQMLDLMPYTPGQLPADCALYFTRKAGKAFQAAPVGKTWL